MTEYHSRSELGIEGSQGHMVAMSGSKVFALFVHRLDGAFEVRLALTRDPEGGSPDSHGRHVEQGDRAYAGAILGAGDSLEQAMADARRSHMWPDQGSRLP